MEHLTWRTSSYSSDDGNCVEVAELVHGGRAVRDSKHPTGPVLVVTPGQWAVFTASARGGTFD
ncbi:MAG: DUF397 domain-containing protein [Pseudonocardiaceae bacterium]